MRNVFDQYSQPENRVTHALFTALNEDRDLLRDFLSEVAKVRAPVAAKNFQLFEQTLPGEVAEYEESSELSADLQTVFRTAGLCRKNKPGA